TLTSHEGSSTATASEVIVVTATAGPAEAPTFGGSSTFSGSEETSFALTGISAGPKDPDDTLGTTATISGVASGWTVFDGSTALSGSTMTLPTADLGSLTILAPDAGSAATDSLTLTVTSSEGSS